MTDARYLLAAATTGHYALFAGGSYSTNRMDAVDVYDENLLRLTPLTLSVPYGNHAGISKEGFAVFAGGYGPSLHKNIEAFDETLTRIPLEGLSVARDSLAAAHTGKHILFGGGGSSTSGKDTVDVYTIN